MPRGWASGGSVAGAIALLVGVSLEARVQCQYDVELITLPDCPPYGAQYPAPESVNSAGDVVGYYAYCVIGPDQPFLWTAEKGMTTIALPAGVANGRAYDISDCGWIVGTMGGVASPTRGFLINDDGIIDLGTLPGGNISEALALNDAGQVVGYWGNSITGPGQLAYLWEDGAMIDLTPDLETPWSRGSDINELGTITGRMGSSPLVDARAFVWKDGVVTDLGRIPGGITSEGQAINNRDHVTGFGFVDGVRFDRRAFLWRHGVMMDLGVLPGCTEALAYDLNDADQVVGHCGTQGEWPMGFMWQHGVMTSLDSLVVPSTPGTYVFYPTAINNEGQITAIGWLAYEGGTLLLTPKDRPVGDADIDCHVGVLDLLAVLASWGPCTDCLADVNSDGEVDVFDLLLVLTNWG